MSLPKWLLDAGADPSLWRRRLGGDVEHIANKFCVAWAGPYNACFRVPHTLAPAVIKLIEESLPKPPSKEEDANLSAGFVIESASKEVNGLYILAERVSDGKGSAWSWGLFRGADLIGHGQADKMHRAFEEAEAEAQRLSGGKG